MAFDFALLLLVFLVAQPLFLNLHWRARVTMIFIVAQPLYLQTFAFGKFCSATKPRFVGEPVGEALQEHIKNLSTIKIGAFERGRKSR